MMEELNLNALENTLKQLQEGLECAKSDPADELWRDGVIQRFESLRGSFPAPWGVP